jgi:hypothetical protein
LNLRPDDYKFFSIIYHEISRSDIGLYLLHVFNGENRFTNIGVRKENTNFALNQNSPNSIFGAGLRLESSSQRRAGWILNRLRTRSDSAASLSVDAFNNSSASARIASASIGDRLPSASLFARIVFFFNGIEVLVTPAINEVLNSLRAVAILPLAQKHERQVPPSREFINTRRFQLRFPRNGDAGSNNSFTPVCDFCNSIAINLGFHSFLDGFSCRSRNMK